MWYSILSWFSRAVLSIWINIRKNGTRCPSGSEAISCWNSWTMTVLCCDVKTWVSVSVVVVVITNLLGGLSAIVDSVVAQVVNGSLLKRVFCCQCHRQWQIFGRFCTGPSMTCGSQCIGRIPDHLAVKLFSASFGILLAVAELRPDWSVVVAHSLSSWVFVVNLGPLNLFVRGQSDEARSGIM